MTMPHIPNNSKQTVIADMLHNTYRKISSCTVKPYLYESTFGEFLVNLRSVCDVLGSVSIVQCTERLFHVDESRRHCGYD